MDTVMRKILFPKKALQQPSMKSWNLWIVILNSIKNRKKQRGKKNISGHYKISEKMQESYKISPTIAYDRHIPETVWNFYDRNGLLKEGIAIRGLIVLGDEFEYKYNKNTFSKDVPSVMVEAGFIHDWKLGGNKALKEISTKIYEALTNIYIN